MKRPPLRRRRLPRLESLEKRHLLAAYISELHLDPLYGDADDDQYVELRGEPNATLPSGTFLTIVEGDEAKNEGEIHGIFDLSNLPFGSNGFLAFLQRDHSFQVDANANVLVSTELGFGGLPGNIYRDLHPNADRMNFFQGSSTFLLIQTDTPIELGTDIDADDDGAIDEAFAQAWHVFDSVSMLSGDLRDVAYGKIVFHMADQYGYTAPPDATKIETERITYAARIGDSTGWEPADWVSGTTNDYPFDDEKSFHFARDGFFDPTHTPFIGRKLDHVGTHNFVGAVRGSFQYDESLPGIGGAPVPGVFVYADSNGNRQLDELEFSLDLTEYYDPEKPLEQPDLTNVLPGVTLTIAGRDNAPKGTKVRPQLDRWYHPVYVERVVFAHAGVHFIPDTARLRADFYNPATSVSIDAIGVSSLEPLYGRLEAYDQEGNSLGYVVSEPLWQNEIQRLTFSTETPQIAYAVMYSSEEPADGTPFGQFNNFSYTQPEASAVSDENGEYVLSNLFPGEYTVIGPETEHLAPVTFTENYRFDEYIKPNLPPEILDQAFAIPETLAQGDEVGQLQATDFDDTRLRYAIVDGADAEAFRIEPFTGNLVVAHPDLLDFETQPQLTVDVTVTDPSGGRATATITINLEDANEPPGIAPTTFTLEGDVQNGMSIGTIEATDQDAGGAGVFSFALEGELAAAFSVDAQSGELRLIDKDLLVTQAEAVVTVTAVATDEGTPPQQGRGTISIELDHLNRAPVLTIPQIQIVEGTETAESIALIDATDPNEGQTVTLEIVGGTAKNLFTIDAANGHLFIVPGTEFNYEKVSSYTLEIRATDNGTPFRATTGTATISILDHNDPPLVELPQISIPENVTAPELIGFVQAQEEDFGQRLSYSIIGGSARDFIRISQSSGLLHLDGNPKFDFETSPTETLTIQVQDTGGPPARVAETLTLSITDVNEPPEILTGELSAPESTEPHQSIGHVIVADPDADEDLHFSIIGGDGANLFTIDPQTGSILLSPGAALDHETLDYVHLDVRVEDKGELVSERRVGVNIVDINEPPVLRRQLANLALTGNTEFSYDLPEDLFSDPEGDITFRYRIEWENGEPVTWLQIDPVTGRIIGRPRPDHVGTFTLFLSVSDQGDPPAVARFELTVDVAPAPNPWHNGAVLGDVDGDNEVKPLDALRVINFLNSFGVFQVGSDDVDRPGFLDVDGDNVVKPIDALRVINLLSQRIGLGEEEKTTATSDEEYAFTDGSIDTVLSDPLAVDFSAADVVDPPLSIADVPDDDAAKETDEALERLLVTCLLAPEH